MDKDTILFKCGVLPELAGKWYTHPPSTSLQTRILIQGSSETQVSLSATSNIPETAATKQKWCYYNGEESGKMTGCKNDTSQ